MEASFAVLFQQLLLHMLLLLQARKVGWLHGWLPCSTSEAYALLAWYPTMFSSKPVNSLYMFGDTPFASQSG